MQEMEAAQAVETAPELDSLELGSDGFVNTHDERIQAADRIVAATGGENERLNELASQMKSNSDPAAAFEATAEATLRVNAERLGIPSSEIDAIQGDVLGAAKAVQNGNRPEDMSDELARALTEEGGNQHIMGARTDAHLVDLVEARREAGEEAVQMNDVMPEPEPANLDQAAQILGAANTNNTVDMINDRQNSESAAAALAAVGGPEAAAIIEGAGEFNAESPTAYNNAIHDATLEYQKHHNNGIREANPGVPDSELEGLLVEDGEFGPKTTAAILDDLREADVEDAALPAGQDAPLEVRDLAESLRDSHIKSEITDGVIDYMENGTEVRGAEAPPEVISALNGMTYMNGGDSREGMGADGGDNFTTPRDLGRGRGMTTQNTVTAVSDMLTEANVDGRFDNAIETISAGMVSPEVMRAVSTVFTEKLEAGELAETDSYIMIRQNSLESRRQG